MTLDALMERGYAAKCSEGLGRSSWLLTKAGMQELKVAHICKVAEGPLASTGGDKPKEDCTLWQLGLRLLEEGFVFEVLRRNSRSESQYISLRVSSYVVARATCKDASAWEASGMLHLQS